MPGLAIAEAMVQRGHARSSIVFAGARSGMESDLVPPHGFPLEVLDVRNFPRKVMPVRHAVSAWKQARALAQAWRRLGAARPGAVVSLGGFASVPWVLAARRRGIPVVVVSYDAIPGRASHWQAHRATATAVAFPEVALPRTRFTGTPLRPEVLAVDRARDRGAARRELGLPQDAFVVAAFGGSLGSGAVNDAIRSVAERRAGDAGLAIRHVVGRRNAAAFVPVTTSGLTYQVVPFEDRMPLLYAAADLAVARAGATSVAELAAVGLPSILAPWPLAAEDHQTANARWLVDAGAAVLLRDEELHSRLDAEIERLRQDPAALARMAAAAAAVARRDAADAVAALVDEVAANAEAVP
jgi:UDP-N-acetylglucosamine--N-acetylmuramyl-(pentapeptide) pyrophosphoryl-undecaprenol N-acetylglucosamine transferase